jgi:hypothetical protein
MTARLGMREGVVSAVVFSAVLFALVSVDPRVREHVSELYSSGSVTPWGDRLGDLAGTLMAVVRDQSLDNAPLLVFATVGAMLTLFMFKS